MVKYIFAVCLASAVCLKQAAGFWDEGTTTFRYPRDKDEGRTSFFRWQWTYLPTFRSFFNWWDFYDIDRRMKLGTVCGLSIDWQCITTCSMLTRRCAITSHNALYPHIVRSRDLRLWAPGAEAKYNTPYRYRVHRVHPVSPRSGNPEHCHGPYCAHQPRHDVAVVITKDQIYLYNYQWWNPYNTPTRYFYPFRAELTTTWTILAGEIWYAGSGFEYIEHIRENYKIFYGLLNKYDVVDCSKYLPKWWGKFICIRNWRLFPGIQNGGPLYRTVGPNAQTVVGLGCFEIRYNDEKIFVFTDLRYYRHKVAALTQIRFHAYYEFAYPQWMVKLSYISSLFDSTTNDPMIPYHYWMYHIDDSYFLG